VGKVTRINRAIELLEADQPIYYTGPGERSFEGGERTAGTWADYIAYDVEHAPFDVARLADFMRGMAQQAPTRSGHRTPTVIVTLPMEGTSEAAVRANAWMIKQVLATGVHGLLLCHAEDPAAVRAFVEAARYPYQTAGVGEQLGEGRRGNGGQAAAAVIWGIPTDEYLRRADPWPLNPRGELLLGIKVENKRALATVDRTTRVPGIAFAEWGPGDMGMSYGFPNQHDAPYPPVMWEARNRVMQACQAAHIAFLESVTAQNVVQRIAEGVRIGAGAGPDAAEIGRRHTRRTLPW
jgi:4-hydroxy-2-oxoheptanedioate aldolase